MELKEILQLAVVALSAVLCYKDLTVYKNEAGVESTVAPNEAKMFYYLILVGAVLQVLVTAKVIKIASSKWLAVLPAILMLAGAALILLNINKYPTGDAAKDSAKSATQLLAIAVAGISAYNIFNAYKA